MKSISIKQKIVLILCGIMFCLFLIEIGLRIAGAIWLVRQEQRNIFALKQAETFRILCLGESTTAFGYPQYLEEFLNQSNPKINFRIINKGVGGYDTGRILTALENNLNKYKPHMVITMMGVNDVETTLSYGVPSSNKCLNFLQSQRIYKLAGLIYFRMTHNRDHIEKSNTQLLAKLVDEEAELIKAIELDKTNDKLYFDLAWLYRNIAEHQKAEKMLEKAIELNTNIELAYVGLDQYYSNRGEYAKSEEMLKKTLKTNPYNYQAIVLLLNCYKKQGKNSELKELLQNITQENPREANRVSGAIALLFEELREYTIADEYFNRATTSRINNALTVTRHNYRKLKEIVLARGIALVCVQYPLRSISELKIIFKDTKYVTFVDNEMVFKKALRNGTYNMYFADNFGGDFGHGTEKGNKLLAKNIADTILKKYFNLNN